MRTLFVLTLAVVVYGVMLSRLTDRIDILEHRVDEHSVRIEMLHKMASGGCYVAAAGDGEADDAPAIQEALNRSARGECNYRVNLVPLGTYHLRSWLQFKDGQTILDGHGASIKGHGSPSGDNE